MLSRKTRRWIWKAIVFVIIVGTLMSQVFAGPVRSHDEIRVPNSFYLDWPLAEGDPNHRLFISVPEGEVPAAGFPVVYLMDGNAFFTTAVDLSRQLSHALKSPKQPAIIVAVGYPIDGAYDYQRRWYDLTPPTPEPPAVPLKHMARYKDIRYGGAENVLQFMTHTLRPWLAERYPINPEQQILFGHSLGGLFTLYALQQHPNAFSGYGAISPSLWWNEGYLKTPWQKVETSVIADKQVVMVVGAEEKDFMLQDSNVANDWLLQQGVRSKRFVLEAMDHGTVSIPALAIALRELLPAADAQSHN
ncbi:alpha/beta hydrolase [Rhodanobacter aciditrophus]|uniref:Alpha/beta hydrolase n=1 Tax=Rhodanobacter aciditrophus TaxID=1623218 RepID=A0ABW4B166_9GAMM